MKKLLAVVALVATMALPAGALAAGSQNAAMTLTVGASISVDGVPTSLDFGSPLAGTTASAPMFTVVTGSNNGATFHSTVSDLTATSGTITKSNVSETLNGGGSVAADGHLIPVGSTDVVVSVAVPAAQAAGAYSGTFTISGT